MAALKALSTSLSHQDTNYKTHIKATMGVSEANIHQMNKPFFIRAMPIHQMYKPFFIRAMPRKIKQY